MTEAGIRALLLSVPALLMGTALVGKFGPPTIGFLMAPFYLCFGALLRVLPEEGVRSSGKILKTGIILVAVLGLSVATSRELVDSARRASYRNYQSFLKESVGGDGRVLANLNTAFAFDYDRLVIWRDLAQLPETGDADKGPLEKFLDESGVKWIVVPEELELIHASRPVWNGLYGNPRWYPELEDILSRRGIEVSHGAFPDYAMRIVPFMDRKDWILRIYRIE